jgi:hypothetical protein
MHRQKLMQEIMTQRLLHLVPDAKISVRPYENNEHLVANPVIRGNMLIDWQSETVTECPSLEVIESVTQEQIEAKENADRKSIRNAEKANDLTLKALYHAERKLNPDLKFSDYLDSIEAIKV